MALIKTFDREQKPSQEERTQFANFLFQHLENYGDPISDIEKCLAYVLDEGKGQGGKVFSAYNDGVLTGVVIVNSTGMKAYIPENILVYIATHKDYRGQGIGKQLMLAAIENVDGDIALHVEPDNPAKKLYEKLGFTNKYLEMRFSRKK
ncbi:MAG: GNAT family N-acetyltransferase [Crocinitomicaceae bacterium]|nr:GNAT family N-acetyltransferase [Crocinitomicaceae bacterium]